MQKRATTLTRIPFCYVPTLVLLLSATLHTLKTEINKLLNPLVSKEIVMKTLQSVILVLSAFPLFLFICLLHFYPHISFTWGPKAAYNFLKTQYNKITKHHKTAYHKIIKITPYPCLSVFHYQVKLYHSSLLLVGKPPEIGTP